jgi:parallel beta-helix repeat protein
MKRFFSFAIIFIVSILFSSYCNAEFYVVATNKRIGTEIKALPYTVASPGFYYITKNLTSIGGGITVDSDDVTIDLMGFTIYGPEAGAPGISFTSRSNIEIRNGTIHDFSYGIQGLTDGQSNKVIGVKLISNSGYGIFMHGNNHVVRDCIVISSGAYGIYMVDAGAHGHIVAGNAVYNSYYNGITVGAGSMITGNISNRNREHGITVFGGCTVMNNTVYNNGGMGIISSNNGSSIINNTVTDNPTANISIGGQHNSLVGNLVTGSAAGIELGNTENFYDQNRAANNTTDFSIIAGNTDGGNNVSF